jgi:hypothetical protein
MSKFEDNLMNTEGMSDERLSDPRFNSDLEMKAIDYDPNGMPNSDRARERAVVEGLDVVYPEPNQLFIDIDNEHSYRLFENQLTIVNKFIGYFEIKEAPSKSSTPDNFKMHVTLTFGKLVTFTPLERLALQAMLGSDRVRELLGYIEMKNDDPTPTLFLENNKLKQLKGNIHPDAGYSSEILTDEEIPY